MATIRESVSAQSKALSDAAAEILAQPKVEGRRYVPLTSAEAVLRYAGDFIPSWAGAISIDLLPAVLVVMMCIVHAVMRRDEDTLEAAERISAADMMRSLDLHEALTKRHASDARDDPAPGDAAIAESDRSPTKPENVTPLSLAERKRMEP